LASRLIRFCAAAQNRAALRRRSPRRSNAQHLDDHFSSQGGISENEASIQQKISSHFRKKHRRNLQQALLPKKETVFNTLWQKNNGWFYEAQESALEANRNIFCQSAQPKPHGHFFQKDDKKACAFHSQMHFCSFHTPHCNFCVHNESGGKGTRQ